MEVHPLLHELDSLLAAEPAKRPAPGAGGGISPGKEKRKNIKTYTLRRRMIKLVYFRNEGRERTRAPVPQGLV